VGGVLPFGKNSATPPPEMSSGAWEWEREGMAARGEGAPFNRVLCAVDKRCAYDLCNSSMRR